MLLEGQPFAAAIREELAALAARRQAALGYPVELAIVVLRDGTGNSASDVYVRQLRRAARSVGIASRTVDLPAATDAETLLATLAALNDDSHVHGIIVQLPLPPHLSRETLLDAIAPEKDVDGITATNAGNLFLNLPALVPATCAAVMEMLDRASIALDGRRVVVVGAGAVVGRPLALMLLQRHATVSVCHIYTEDLPSFTRQAEVLVVAAGRPGLITAEMVRPGATVIDVGINVLPDGSVVGDVAFAAVREVAGAITPVPGGIGPLTNLMVMQQTLRRLDGMHTG
jgi:methylenetetrahydrofolate dehydrogenase (NADP+) / methenyltetrahydrofolate cyclohydrolase